MREEMLMTGSAQPKIREQHAATPPAAETGIMHRARVKAFLTATQAVVETDAGESITAAQAASCLLAPAIGDSVLLCEISGEAYILAILQRDDTRIAEIAVPGAGKVKFAAAERLELTAPAISIAAGRFSVIAEAMVQTGQSLASNFKRVVEIVVDKTIGARTVTTTAETRTSVIRDVEMLNAGSLIQNIDSVATQNSEIALVTARRDVRLDAERVSVG
jgi:hypothetical protein